MTRYVDAGRPSDRAVLGDEPDAARRHREGAGPVRVLVRPVGRGHAVGTHAALAASLMRAITRLDVTRRRGASPASRSSSPPRTSPAATYGLISADQPVFAVRRRPLRGAAGRRGRGRSSRDRARRACAAIVVEYEVLDPLIDPERAIEATADPSRRQRVPPPAHRARRRGRHRRRRRRGHVRDRHAGSGVPRPRVGARASRQRRPRRRALHLDAVAARGPSSDRGLPRAARGTSAAAARRRRWRVRRPRGREPAGARVLARAAHRSSGEDDVRPGRVVLRSRAPAPGSHLDAPPRPGRRHAREGRVPRDPRRRRVRVDVQRGAHQRRHPRAGSVPRAERRIDGWAVRTNNPPCGAMRGFGVQQACFAHESQMDKLAAACGLDPVEMRLRNAIETGDRARHRPAARERGADHPLLARDRGAAASAARR